MTMVGGVTEIRHVEIRTEGLSMVRQNDESCTVVKKELNMESDLGKIAESCKWK